MKINARVISIDPWEYLFASRHWIVSYLTSSFYVRIYLPGPIKKRWLLLVFSWKYNETPRNCGLRKLEVYYWEIKNNFAEQHNVENHHKDFRKNWAWSHVSLMIYLVNIQRITCNVRYTLTSFRWTMIRCHFDPKTAHTCLEMIEDSIMTSKVNLNEWD